MRTLLNSILISLSSTIFVFAQTKFEPAILVLYPNELLASKIIKSELEVFVQETEITDEIRKSFVREGLAPNWKMIREKELEFARKQDFLTILALTLTREFTYREVQHHDNLLIFPVKETSNNDKAAYKLLCEKYGVGWLVNILKVELSYSTESKKIMKFSLHLFSNTAGWLLIDSTYTTDDSVSPDACEKGSWLCLIENIKNRVAKEVTDKVERNRHHQ